MAPGHDWRQRRNCAAAFRAGDRFPALLLAAGASRRFNGCKALARYSGRALIDHAIDQARHVSSDVRALTGCRAALLQWRAQHRPSSWVHTELWREGMSASLKRGIDTLPASAVGVFVVLVDQPLIGPEDLQRLRQTAMKEPYKPLAADYRGRPGAPAYLPRWLWPAIMALEGDRGAGGLLQAARAQRLRLQGAIEDVDTRDDLARLTTQR